MTTTTVLRANVTKWGKDHQLVAAEAIRTGEVVVSETPFVAASSAAPQYSTAIWDLVDKILSSPDLLQRFYQSRLKVTKFWMDQEDLQNERALAKKHNRTRESVRTTYFGVATNNVGYEDATGGIVGHGIYPVFSRANHSCRPNAKHAAGNLEQQEISLVAIRDLAPGEAVTWNYADNTEFCRLDYFSRNCHIMNFWCFVCNCERCQEDIPPKLAGHPNLYAYFDKILKQEAARQRALQMAAPYH